MTGPINPDGLIHDLAILVAGSLHPGAKIGPAPRLAAHRMRDVLGIADGELVAGIERELRAALDIQRPATGVLHRDPAITCEWVPEQDDPAEPCSMLSQFAVERSDGASPVAALPDMDHTRCEACEYHLAEVVGWMLGGDDSLRAIVTPRWWDDGPEADQ